MFDAKEFIPKPRTWFKTKITYSGLGTAIFSNISTPITGHTTVKFDQLGDCTIVMMVDKKYLNDIRDEEILAGCDFPSIKAIGRCKSLVVQANNGVFSTQDISSKINISIPHKIIFHTGKSQFNVNSPIGSPKYWLMPLLNLASEGIFSTPKQLQSHPLRLYSFKEIPKGGAHDDELSAISNIMSYATINLFQFNDEVGFIDYVPQFYKYRNSLMSWKKIFQITAIMVANIGSGNITIENLKKTLPIDFLSLLSIASGLEVGMPWVEIYDEHGNLIQRIHVWNRVQAPYQRRPPFHPPIRPEDVGQLLTNFAQSPHYENQQLRAAIRQYSRSGLFSRNIEETVGFLSRALEELCGYYKVRKANLSTEIKADSIRSEVKDILKNAAQQLNALKGTDEENKVINKIKSRVENANNTEHDFGDSVKRLLELPEFQFPDTEIINQFFDNNPTYYRSWQQALSYIRGTSAHKNFFDVDEPNFSMQETLKVIYHLHDVTLRIILKMIGYKGKYQSLIGEQQLQIVDWVTKETTPSQLGY